MTNLRVRPITRDEHLAFVAGRPSASHMQVPSWGEVKPDRRAESLGWFEETGGQLVGVGLVLYRPVPKLKKYLAYLPEGPVIDWHTADLDRWLDPMLAHLKSQGAFTVKMGPPVVVRRWSADAVKAAIADPDTRRLRDAEPTSYEPRAYEIADRLRRAGWQQTEPGGEDGFAAGQPRYVFQVPFAGRSLDDIHRGLNQQWRRNIKKAEKAGVKVVQGGHDADRRPARLVLLRRLHQPPPYTTSGASPTPWRSPTTCCTRRWTSPWPVAEGSRGPRLRAEAQVR